MNLKNCLKCLDGKSAWNKNEGTYVTDLLKRNASTLTDFCVLANIEKYKSLAGNQAYEQLLGVEHSSLGLRRKNFILITVVSIEFYYTRLFKKFENWLFLILYFTPENRF